MKACYVKELAEGAKVDAVFALRAKEIRATRAAEAYLSLEIADRTGRIPAVYFRPSPEASAVPVGSVVRVRGTVTSFRGAKRVSVDSLGAASSWDPEDLLAAGARSTEEMVAEFKALVRSVSDPELRRVLTAVFGNREFFERFVRCPGAQSFHHAYLGGLLEHTISVASLCHSLGEQYPHVERDLLLAAALLHDIGKVDELSFDVAIGYTDSGRLLGHVVLGMNRLHDAVSRARIKMSGDRLARLEHAVVSHHGELEWGSPNDRRRSRRSCCITPTTSTPKRRVSRRCSVARCAPTRDGPTRAICSGGRSTHRDRPRTTGPTRPKRTPSTRGRQRRGRGGVSSSAEGESSRIA